MKDILQPWQLLFVILSGWVHRQHTGSRSTFLKSHWDVHAAIDFTTIEVWTKGGLVTYYLLFVMELKTRRVRGRLSSTRFSHSDWYKDRE